MAGQIPKGHIPIDDEASPEHLLETDCRQLNQLDEAVQGAFLQRLLKSLTSVNVTEKESVVHWQRILARRNELEEKLGRKVSLRTAAVDYLGQLPLLRNPILLEYEELKTLRYNAAMDPLTGLNNRRMFEEYLDREINRSGRYHPSFALLLLGSSQLQECKRHLRACYGRRDSAQRRPRQRGDHPRLRHFLQDWRR